MIVPAKRINPFPVCEKKKAREREASKIRSRKQEGESEKNGKGTTGAEATRGIEET